MASDRDLKLRILGDDRTRSATDSAARNFDKLGRKVDGVSGSISKGLGGALKSVGAIAATSGLLAIAGPIGAAAVAMGAFAAVALPFLSKIEKSAGAKSLVKDFDDLSTTMQPLVMRVATLAEKAGKDLLPTLGALAKTGGSVLTGFLKPFDSLLKSSTFDSFVASLTKFGKQAGQVLGPAVVKLLAVLMQLFTSIMPSGVKILSQLLPSVVELATDLSPVVVVGAKVVAWVTTMLTKLGLLTPVLAGLGVMWAIGFGPVGIAVAAIVAIVLAITHFWETSSKFRNVIETVFSAVGKVVLTFAEIWLDEMHLIVNAFLDFVSAVIHGAADAFGWIPGVGPKLKGAAKAFDDFKDSVSDVFDKAHAKIEGWKRDLANMPKVAKLKGDITDLTSKLDTAERELKNPDLTKTRRARILADISNAVAGIAAIKNKMAALNGQTSTVYVDYVRGGQGYVVPHHRPSSSAANGWEWARGGSQAGVTQPAAQPMTANVTSTLVLDGRVIDRRVQQVVAANNRRQKVGYR